MSNINLDQKKTQIFRKLAKKDKTIIERIRKVYLENELESADIEDFYDVIDKLIKERVKKISKKELIEYWEDCYDADFEIVPKKTLKTLTKKEMEIINEN